MTRIKSSRWRASRTRAAAGGTITPWTRASPDGDPAGWARKEDPMGTMSAALPVERSYLLKAWLVVV
ncbi:MAG: hypothetical protein ACXWXP_09465, partial [Actinomycetota bacterium]